MSIKSKIVGYSEENPKSLIANDLNFRVHPNDQAKIVGASMQELGWFDMVMVSKRTKRILNGHLRVQIAIERNALTVPVRWVQVDEGEEQAILASYDAIGLAATNETQSYKVLLQGITKANGDATNSFFAKVLGALEKKSVTKPKKRKPLGLIVVGAYQISVPGEQFSEWLRSLKKEHKQGVTDEIRKRLGF